MVSAVPAALMPAGLALSGALAQAAIRSDARARARRLRPHRRVLPPAWRARVAVALARADLSLEPESALRIWLGAVVAVGWFALVLAPPLVVPAVGVAAIGAPLAVRLRRGRADRRVVSALPAALDLVVAHLRAGGTVGEGVVALASAPGPLAVDFRRVAARRSLGATLEVAVDAWGAERPLPEVRAAAGALALVTAVGGPAATPLEGLASTLRADIAATNEARALSVQARMSAVLVGLSPIAYLAFSTMTDPASARVLVGTGAGRLCLVGGLGLEALAALWIRRLVGSSP